MKNCFLTKKMAIALSASMAILGILMSPITAKAEDYTWQVEDGTAYWYENGVKQGTYDDTKGVIGDGTIRGREIYDPESDGWYWLDACYDGAKACNKEVWIPYVYQNEDNWDDAEIKANAEASGNMAAQVETTIREGNGKWVRYDENGKMYKGWYKVDGDQADIYPDQEGNVYYYDKVTGLMAKGEVVIDGMEWEFDNQTGVLIGGEERMTTLTPQPDGSWFYTPNGVFDNSYTGLVYDETVGWWYVENGVINFNYTGLVPNEYGWWYVENGTINFNYNGLIPNDAGWWCVAGGKVCFDYTGLWSDPNVGWWYVENGAINFDYNGIASNEAGNWVVVNGQVDFSQDANNQNNDVVNGLACIDGMWVYLKDGNIDTSYTGIAQNEHGYWYVKNGYLDTSYTGRYVNESDKTVEVYSLNDWKYSFDDFFKEEIKERADFYEIKDDTIIFTTLLPGAVTWEIKNGYVVDSFVFDKDVLNGYNKYENPTDVKELIYVDGRYCPTVKGKYYYNYTGVSYYFPNETNIPVAYYLNNGVIDNHYTGMAQYNLTDYIYFIDGKQQYAEQNDCAAGIRHRIDTFEYDGEIWYWYGLEEGFKCSKATWNLYTREEATTFLETYYIPGYITTVSYYKGKLWEPIKYDLIKIHHAVTDNGNYIWSLECSQCYNLIANGTDTVHEDTIVRTLESDIDFISKHSKPTYDNEYRLVDFHFDIDENELPEDVKVFVNNFRNGIITSNCVQ